MFKLDGVVYDLFFQPSLGWPEWLPVGLGTSHIGKTLIVLLSIMKGD